MLREKKRDGSGVTTVADSSEVDGFVVGQESAAVRVVVLVDNRSSL